MKAATAILFALAWSVHLVASPFAWTTSEQTVVASAGEQSVSAVFTFRNTSDRLITITRIDPDCLCLFASYPEHSIAPGATDSVKITFSIGNKIGLVHHSLRLYENGQLDATPLYLNVLIEEIASVEPVVLVWRSENAEPRDVTITPHGKRAIRVVNVSGETEMFDVAIDKNGQSGTFRLRIIPKDSIDSWNHRLTAVVWLSDGAVVRKEILLERK